MKYLKLYALLALLLSVTLAFTGCNKLQPEEPETPEVPEEPETPEQVDEIELPTVKLFEDTLVVRYTTATVFAEVTDNGNDTVTQRGFCYGLQDAITDTVFCGDGIGRFTVMIDSLAPGSTYGLVAFARNSAGIGVSEKMSFITLEYGCPEVTTASVTDITETTALGGGTVFSDGESPVTERGLCWSTEPNPTVEGFHMAAGEGLGSYSCDMEGLMANTTYYVRAYATNTKGTSYGQEIHFITSATPPVLPTVTTGLVTDITLNTAVGHGQVTADGGAEVTERGLCWGTSPSPDLNGNHAESGSGIGSFNVSLTGLEVNTTYHVRAYATNEAGTSYGEDVQFTTENYAPLQINTLAVTEITQNSAVCGGEIVSDGGHDIIERGICWNITGNPTTDHFHAVATENTATFTCPMTGLSTHYTYFVRAYFKTTQGVTYGNEVSFSTLGDLPLVSITDMTLIVSPIVQFFAKVMGNGGSYVTERGICWGTNPMPTIADNHFADAEAGEGNYSGYVNRLTPRTTYYFRAYAINEEGVGYSEQREIFTDSELPNGPEGAVKGYFTVGSNKRVRFSKGNLQCRIVDASSSSYQWRFAEHQYDYIGEANANVSSSYPDWFDLFGWGTSGWNCGNTYYQPYERRGGNNGPNFGPLHPNNLTGKFANSDWGVFNAISNGGNTAGQWRTLTNGEWEYLLNDRLYDNGFDCWVKAQVNQVNGVIVLPDNWNRGYFPLTGYNQWISTTYSDNIISATDWENTFEALGVVFLPAAGQCQGHEALLMNEQGFYWSSTHDNNFQQYAYDVHFDEQRVLSSVWEYKHYCLSVRLVQDE